MKKQKHKGEGDNVGRDKVVNVNFLFPTLLIFALLLSSIVYFSYQKNYSPKSDEIKKMSHEEDKCTTPLFERNTPNQFNVLILPFEEYYLQERDPNCIGVTIEEKLNVIREVEELNLDLRVKYTECLSRPKSIEDAKKIQNQNNADLVIYGLAKNIQDYCSGADVCFRYRIAASVVETINPIVSIQTQKHDLDYFPTSPTDIEEGALHIDNITLKHWITSLINLKANMIDEALLELDSIGSNSLLSDQERSKRYMLIGNKYSRSKPEQPKMALKAYYRALEINPESYFIYSLIASIHSKFFRYEKALEAYAKYFELAPRSANLAVHYNNRAAVYSHLGLDQEALNDYNEALKLGPNCIFFGNRANLYRELGLLGKAKEGIEKAITDCPDLGVLYFGRGNLFSAQENYELAVQDYTKALESKHAFKDRFNVFEKRGHSYFQLKKYKEAIDDFTSAIKLKSGAWNLYYSRARAYTSLEQYKSAIGDYDKIIKIDSDNAHLFNSRGTLYSRTGDYQMALLDYSKAIDLDQSESVFYFNRGVSYMLLQLRAEAIIDFNRCLELNPNFTQAYEMKEQLSSSL